MSFDCWRLERLLRSREPEDLTAAQRRRLEAHLSSCKACADAFTPLEAPLADLLRDEAKESARRREESVPGELFRPRLEERLRRAGSGRWGWHLMRLPTPLGLRMPQALAGTLALVLVLAAAFWAQRAFLGHEESVRVAEIPMPVKKEAGEEPPAPEVKLQSSLAGPVPAGEAQSPARPAAPAVKPLSAGTVSSVLKRIPSPVSPGQEEQERRSTAMEFGAVVAHKKIRVIVPDPTPDPVEQAPGAAVTDEGETVVRGARYYETQVMLGGSSMTDASPGKPLEESPKAVTRVSPEKAEKLPTAGAQFQDLVEQAPGAAVTGEGETVVRGARYYGATTASSAAPQPASPRATVGVAAAAPSSPAMQAEKTLKLSQARPAQAEPTSPGSPPGTYFGWSKVEGQVGVWKKALTEGEIASLLANRKEKEEVDQIVRANPQEYYQDYLLGPVADISQPSEQAALALSQTDHPIAIKAYVDRGDEGSITSLYNFIMARFDPFEIPSAELQQAAEELAVPLFRERLTGPGKMRAAETLYFLGHVEEALPVFIEAVENGKGMPRAFFRAGEKFDENCGCELWFWDLNLKPVYEAGLKSTNLGVRETAAGALIRIGETELAFAALQELLKQDIERSLVVDFIGRGILFDLGLIGTPKAMRVVAKFLKHEDAEIRFRAREICTERKFIVEPAPGP